MKYDTTQIEIDLEAVFKIDPNEAVLLVEELTMRERQVAERIAMGVSRQQIEAELGIAHKTLEHYISNILRKLKTTSHGIARIWFCAAMALEPQRV